MQYVTIELLQFCHLNVRYLVKVVVGGMNKIYEKFKNAFFIRLIIIIQTILQKDNVFIDNTLNQLI